VFLKFVRNVNKLLLPVYSGVYYRLFRLYVYVQVLLQCRIKQAPHDGTGTHTIKPMHC